MKKLKKWIVKIDPESVLLVASLAALLVGIGLYDYRVSMIIGGLAGIGVLVYRRVR